MSRTIGAFPNPSSNNFGIEPCENRKLKSRNYRIYAMLGRKVKSGKINSGTNTSYISDLQNVTCTMSIKSIEGSKRIPDSSLSDKGKSQ